MITLSAPLSLAAAAAAGPSAAGALFNAPAVLMILIFLFMTGLMYARRISALLALPIMAFLFAVVGLVRARDFFGLLDGALGAGLALRLEACAVAWVALVAVCVWLGRRGRAPALVIWLAPVAGAFLAALYCMDAIAMLSARRLWGELLNCLELKTITDRVVHKGALKLHEAYTVAFFGGMLAIYVKEKRLAETVIKYAAELAGDRPFVVALVMMLVTAGLFSTLGGLGAIIMVGSIILPIMLSLGISPLVAAGIFLVGISAGGTFNPGNWALYRESLGVPVEDVQRFALMIVLLYIVTGTVLIGWSLQGRRRRKRWSWAAEAAGAPAAARVKPLALLAPVLPILLVFKLSTFAGLFTYLDRPEMIVVFSMVFCAGLGGLLVALNLLARWTASRRGEGAPRPGSVTLVSGAILVAAHLALASGPAGWTFSLQRLLHAGIEAFSVFAAFWDRYLGGWSFIPAFIAGLIYCMAMTWEKRGGNVRVLTKSMIEGAESVMPAVILMCGIGMLLEAVWMPEVKGYLEPILAKVTPSTKLWYVVGFGLAAPLALYRGPLNVWGLGLGISGVMMGTGHLSGALLMGMLISVGAVQGVCDPTNTHNVWIANFLGEDVLAITRFLLPFIWVMVFFGLLVAALLF